MVPLPPHSRLLGKLCHSATSKARDVSEAVSVSRSALHAAAAGTSKLQYGTYKY